MFFTFLLIYFKRVYFYNNNIKKTYNMRHVIYFEVCTELHEIVFIHFSLQQIIKLK